MNLRAWFERLALACGGHLSERLLTAYDSASLAETEASMAARHLAVCPCCRKRLEETRSAFDALGQVLAGPDPALVAALAAGLWPELLARARSLAGPPRADLVSDEQAGEFLGLASAPQREARLRVLLGDQAVAALSGARGGRP